MDIDQSAKRLRRYGKVVENSTDKTMKKNAARIAKMNVQQMEQGLRADGTYQDPHDCRGRSDPVCCRFDCRLFRCGFYRRKWRSIGLS